VGTSNISNVKENSTKAGLIRILVEEASHIVNGVAGRQIATGTDEKGFESTGSASNAYFQEEYKGSNQNMTYKSDGKIDTNKYG
jgi:putative hemagglutination activity domain protein